jgi:hypothetical protein
VDSGDVHIVVVKAEVSAGDFWLQLHVHASHVITPDGYSQEGHDHGLVSAEA